MGCFNKTGFFSHLPIQYGDEIVLFVFADQSKGYKRSSCPIDPTGGGLTPICPPFFGKYNDYGGIENVVDDPNHKYFTKVVGMTVDKFCDIIHDLSGVTIKDLREGIKKYTEKPESENHYHYETKDDFEKMLALYTKLFKVKEFNIPMPKKDAGLDEETVHKLKETIEELQKWENERIENSAITVGMEHKSVYDSLVAAGKANYGKGWFSRRSHGRGRQYEYDQAGPENAAGYAEDAGRAGDASPGKKCRELHRSADGAGHRHGHRNGESSG